MIEIGRLCFKIAGRDAGKKCVIVDILDDNAVLIDGETRRKRCNIKHIEPLDQKVDIKKGASHQEVVSVLKPLKIKARETKPKEKRERPRKIRKKKEKPATEEKKETKKEEKPKKEKKVEKKINIQK